MRRGRPGIEKPAVGILGDEGLQAADPAGDDGFAGAPGFEDDDAERLMHGGQHEGVAGMEGVDEFRVVVAETGEQADGIGQSLGGDELAEGRA
jgi:hypothetical protein